VSIYTYQNFIGGKQGQPLPLGTAPEQLL